MPTVRVRLLKSLTIPPLHRIAVKVKVDKEGNTSGPLVLEPLQPMRGVLVEPSILDTRDGIACMEVTKQTGYTLHLYEGLELGAASEAIVVSQEPQGTEDAMKEVDLDKMPNFKKVHLDKSEDWRMKKVKEMFHHGLQLRERASARH